MADPTGFEPAISSVTGWHVGPLHHGSVAGRQRIAGGDRLVRGPDRPIGHAAYTPRRCPRSTSAPTPSPCRPTRCAGRWPRPRSATTCSPRTRPSTRSRSGPPSSSARRPACSSRAGRRATSCRSWPTSRAARRPSPVASSHLVDRRGGRPRRRRRGDRSASSRSGPTARSTPTRSPPRSATRTTPTSRSSGLVAIENTHAHSMGRPLDAAYTARIAGDRPRPRRPAPRRRRPLLQRRRRPRDVRPGRARRPGRLGDVLPVARAWPARSARSSSARGRSSAAPGARASSSAAGCARSGVLAAAGLIALRDGPAGMIERLAEDHANARRLGDGLAELPGIVAAGDIAQPDDGPSRPRPGRPRTSSCSG